MSHGSAATLIQSFTQFRFIHRTGTELKRKYTATAMAMKEKIQWFKSFEEEQIK